MLQIENKESYYFAFDQWFDSTYWREYLIYDPRLKQWFQYEKGVFHEIEEDIINTLIFDWDLIQNVKLSTSKLNFLKLRVRARCMLQEEWDADPNIDNCLNGLVDKEKRKLLPHTPDYPSREQIQRNYDENHEGIIPPLFEELLTIIPDKNERDWFIQFCINIVHRNHDDELFCVLYGPKGGGKSTLLQIFELLFGVQNVSKTPLQKIGKRFGLKELYNKRLNVNPDLPIVPMSDNTISLLKQLTGNDGHIEVELKGRDSFTFPIRCFLVFGINQLMGFKATSEMEIESIFRRALLILLPKTLKRDSSFKKKLQQPAFLDDLYSWLVWMRPINILDDDHIDWWVDTQKRKWLDNSNPILAVCKDLFCYCEGEKLGVRYVQDIIRQNLEDAGLFTSQQLQTNVTQALQTMKIHRDNGRGINAKYLNIREIGAEFFDGGEEDV